MENQTPPNRKPNNKILLNIIFLVIIVGFFSILLYGSNQLQAQVQTQREQFSSLISEIRSGKVSTIELSEDRSKFTVQLYKNADQCSRDANNLETKTFLNLPSADRASNNSNLESLRSALGGDSDKFKIGNGKCEIEYTEKALSPWTQILESSWFSNLIWVVLMIGIGFYLLRKLGETNSKSISFGNSRARSYDELDNKEVITFADVAGNEEAKQELTEVVDFLKRPDAYTDMGAKIPRGVLLVGSPGNGKTLLAKAVAGEAGVPFMFVSGSEFVEMFVGVGAGRVRDLFKKAKKKAPCVIFIDEIDAVGRQRGSGLGNGNDEREQTLNQILVELDGFEPSASVIVIGATNRPDVLDPALLRPGRFDRQVTVTAPDRKEREQILAVHSRNKKLSKDIDLGIIAKRTSGFSGADLANLLNEAAILSVRLHKTKITNDILREAIEKVILGPSLRSKVVTEGQKKLTAYHEAGHALTATVLPSAEKVQKITIVPRGKAAGYTFHGGSEQDAMTKKRSEFLDDISVLFGGYAVEQEVFGEVSTGASNDLAVATEKARDMVMRFGMSSLGPISFGKEQGLTFLGRDMVEGKHYSEESAKKIDDEIQLILRECFKTTQAIVKKYRPYLDDIAMALIKNETLEFEEYNAIVEPILVPKKEL